MYHILLGGVYEYDSPQLPVFLLLYHPFLIWNRNENIDVTYLESITKMQNGELVNAQPLLIDQL